jgi:TRAP-type C4-dicarboxylate transport system permease small subunit
MLDTLDKINRLISQLAELIGFAALFLMVVLTCVDVLGTKLFRLPVPGSLDIMALLQVVAISFAASMALIQDRHVEVEFFVMLLPRRLQGVVASLVKLLCLGLFALIAWRLFVHGSHLQAGNEETPTIRIPTAPFSYACAAAMVPVCLVYLQQFFTSLRKVIRNES